MAADRKKRQSLLKQIDHPLQTQVISQLIWQPENLWRYTKNYNTILQHWGSSVNIRRWNRMDRIDGQISTSNTYELKC